jgi:Cu/Ag efflux pump CusA
MTSVVTILAMIPMALGMGESGEMMAPMAVSVISGLAVSMVLTLLLVPTLYVIFEERFKREIAVERPLRRADDPHPNRRATDLKPGA